MKAVTHVELSEDMHQYFLALSHDSTEKHKQSQSYSRRLLKIAQEVGNRELQAQALDVLAWSLQRVHEFPPCTKYCQRLREMANEVRRRGLPTKAYDLLGQSYLLTGKFQESVEYAKAAENTQLEEEARIIQGFTLMSNPTVWPLGRPTPMFLDDSGKEVSFYRTSGMDVSM